MADRGLDPDTWQPPPLVASPSPRRIRGTLYGSRLFEQPAHRAVADRVRAFCAPGPPLALEIGVDRGYRLLGHARRWPDWRWLGVELRRSVLDTAARGTPDNALLVRADARALLAALVPPGRLSRVDILFPTPSDDPRHLLLTPDFAALLAPALAPGAVVLVATDVPGLDQLARAAFAGWPRVAPPESGPVQSRREQVCARTQRTVWRHAFGPPPSAPGGV